MMFGEEKRKHTLTVLNERWTDFFLSSLQLSWKHHCNWHQCFKTHSKFSSCLFNTHSDSSPDFRWTIYVLQVGMKMNKAVRIVVVLPLEQWTLLNTSKHKHGQQLGSFYARIRLSKSLASLSLRSFWKKDIQFIKYKTEKCAEMLPMTVFQTDEEKNKPSGTCDGMTPLGPAKNVPTLKVSFMTCILVKLRNKETCCCPLLRDVLSSEGSLFTCSVSTECPFMAGSFQNSGRAENTCGSKTSTPWCPLVKGSSHVRFCCTFVESNAHIHNTVWRNFKYNKTTRSMLIWSAIFPYAMPHTYCLNETLREKLLLCSEYLFRNSPLPTDKGMFKTEM